MDLATQGKYKCKFCKAVKPLADGLIVTWGGGILFSLCPVCHPGRPIVLKVVDTPHGKAVAVEFLKESDKPVEIVRVQDLSQVGRYVPRAALAKYEKVDFNG